MTNRFAKFLMLGASPLMLAIAQPAYAQSTATQELEAIESVTVTGQAASAGGIMAPVTVAKERTTIGQDYIKTQAAGQSIYEILNKVPGFNFVNNDPYGNSGGNVRIHGFDGAHISFTWDGMPLNDTGNYATYTNQVAGHRNHRLGQRQPGHHRRGQPHRGGDRRRGLHHHRQAGHRIPCPLQFQHRLQQLYPRIPASGFRRVRSLEHHRHGHPVLHQL